MKYAKISPKPNHAKGLRTYVFIEETHLTNTTLKIVKFLEILSLTKRSNIADQTSEKCLSNKLFNRLNKSQNIAHQTFLACEKRNMFSKFFKHNGNRVLLVNQCFVTRPNGQTLFVKQISNV